MTERLFNQQYNTRRLRHLLVLFTFMSVPIVGWADYYDIAIQYGTDESNFHSVLVTADPNDIGGNPTDILGDGTMSYDQESNVLTLSGVNLTCSYESSAFIYHNGFMDSEQVVTVRLVGSNTVTLGNYSYFFEGKQITFTAADNTASLNIITQEGREIDLFPDGVTTTYNDNLAFFPSTSEIKNSETYSLWICGIQVTDANASNVLGDQETPTVVFDAETSSLTLNGATLTAPIKIGLPDLTIDIQGTNTITTTENCIQKMDNTNPSITFKSTSTEVGSLSLYGSSGVYDVGYGSFTISDQFAVILKYYDRYYSNTYYFTDGSTTEAMLTPSYGITVGGMQIGEGNADNVTGEGIGDGSVEVGEMVSFNKTTNTLTLTDAEINGEITYSGTSNLTIAFSGTNAVSTSETSAIQYEGSESDRPKLTFSSTNGTLTINGESIVIEGFSDVDFGSLNLASISAQGVYYDKEYVFMSGYGSTPSDLTITTETYYPIWIYNPSLSDTGYSHTQLRGESTIEIGDGTVSFNGDHTITISNIDFNYEGNALVVVGPSMPALTVDLVGQSTATSGCTVLSLWDTTPLTFTTDASTPGSITGYDIVSWNNFGDGQISYENGLRAFYDADESYQKTISTTGTYIKIGDTSFSETENVTFGEGTAHFDASSNTLTLTDATIGEQGAETSADIQVLVDDLTIEISGTNTLSGNITYNGSNYQSSNIQINKASSAESASLTVTNVVGFSSCTWGDGLYLSAHDAQGATIDVHYEHFEGEGGTMQSYYGEEIADVTFSTTGTNAIWVAGTQVTSDNAGNLFAGDETNDGKVSYDFDTHTLTLDDASLYTNEAQPSPMIISQGALNVLLKGDSYISFNGDYSTYVFQNTGSSGALTISAYDSEASLGVTSDYYEGDYKGLCDGFSQVSFNDDLGLFNRSGSKAIENITRHAPSFYVSDRTVYWSTNDGLLLNATYHYKIDYVDDTIEGSGKEVNLATDETNWGFGGASLDISEFAEPCTITAYTKVNGTITGSNKAKFFTSNPSPFRLVYGADPVDLVLAPAIEESDGISITGIEANVTYNTETGKISSETMGSFGGPVAMREDGQTTILNNYFTMNFEVVPPAPTVSLEAGSYLATHDPITITGTGQANTTIMYQWDDGNAEEFTEAILFQAGTLMAWELYTDGNTVVIGDTTTVVYTLATDLGITYASGQTWATYYATENLTTPEGLTAYVVSSVDATSGTVTTEEVDYIPGNQAVLLKHNNGAPLSGFGAAPYTGAETTVTNMLSGSDEAVSISSFTSGTAYVLHNDGFTRTNSGTIPAHRGYLLLNVAAAPAGSRLAIIGHNVTTGLSEDVIANNEETVYYNLNGQRVAEPRNGVYVVNGKKIIKK